jgi:lipid-A-disaccharide synthase
VALLPGSRKQEIAKKLPIMLSVAPHFPQFEFVVAKAPGQEDYFYEPFMLGQPNVRVVKDSTYALLMQSSAALVTSGTATLETALFGVPEVVCYKGSNISYQIAKRLVKIKFISLVNLIMDKEIVKELIQDELNTNNLVKELNMLLNNTNQQENLKMEYSKLYQLLSAGGHASQNATSLIMNFLKK